MSVLARAITYQESEHREKRDLVTQVLSNKEISLTPILGFTGSPGVGKSTFIEKFGLSLCEQGKRICVLAIDPSSTVSGGSILGDKTRMSELSAHGNAFIRPTPAGTELGGVGARTLETIKLCEAFDFDYIFIETVGVGQSEVEVRYLADLVLLLLEPGAGDELQGIKRGIMEVADIVLINKADQDQTLAKSSKAHYQAALHILKNEEPSVITTSAFSGLHFDLILKEISTRLATNNLAKTRGKHYEKWFYKLVAEELMLDFKNKNKDQLANEDFKKHPPLLIKKYLS